MMEKLTLPEGPWTNIPDYQAWTDPKSGLKCLISKHPEFSTLCGYVRVMRSHRLYGKPMGVINLLCHGGVTFTGKGWTKRWMKRGWWIGFDCGHYGDYNPGMVAILEKIGASFLDSGLKDGVYRDTEYVKTNVELLAFQLGIMK
jgi:hypothetical protein